MSCSTVLTVHTFVPRQLLPRPAPVARAQLHGPPARGGRPPRRGAARAQGPGPVRRRVEALQGDGRPLKVSLGLGSEVRCSRS